MSRRTMDILLLIFAVILISLGSMGESEAKSSESYANPIQLFCQTGHTATFFIANEHHFVVFEDRLYSKEFEQGRKAVFMEVGGQILTLTTLKDHAVLHLYGDSTLFSKSDWRDKVICK